VEANAKAEWDKFSNKEKKNAALDMAKQKYSNAEDVKIDGDKIKYKVDGEWKEGESWKDMGSQYATQKVTEYITQEAQSVQGKI
jgi:hypothetical protein